MDVYRNPYLGPLGRVVGHSPPLPDRKWAHQQVEWLHLSKHLGTRAGSKALAMCFPGTGQRWPRRGWGLGANRPREARPYRMVAGAMMNEERSMETQTPSLERVQEVRLLALLHDLVRQEGRTGAAATLGVHRKTVAAAVNSGRLSRRMHDALGRHLLAGKAAAAPTESVAEARRPWEQHLAAALRRQREDLLAATSAQGQQLRDAAAQRTQALEERVATLEAHWQESGEAAPLGQHTQYGQQVVTAEPAPGEAAAFGVAAPLIVQWRQARDARAGAADHLTAVRAEERLRALELALIGAYHLTLPPATYPWDALTRRHEVDWRRRTLARVRGEHRRAEWRHRLRRVLTLGWW